MKTYKFSQRSLDRMKGLHPDIVAVMELAIKRTPIDFTVLEGLRSEERQRALVAKGASKTMNSRHLTGHAIDVAPIDEGGSVSWDWPLYHKLAPVIKGAADDLGVDLEWGGDWRSFKDGPHWQLSWHGYSKDDMTPRATLSAELGEPIQPREHAPVVEPPVADETKERTSVWQSSTIRAQLVQWLSGSGAGVFAAFNASDDTTRYIIGGLVAVAILAGAWIFKERIRKWVDGDR